MIGFWNRKEVYMGQSMSRYNDIRDILSDNEIKYTYKVVNRNSLTGRSTRGSIGERTELAYMYYVYVHRDDYERAYGMINLHDQK